MTLQIPGRLGSLIVFLAVSAGWGGFVPSPAGTGGEGASYANQPEASPNLEWQGVASCAAAACHHGNEPRGAKGSEYTTWISYDKHAKAFSVLYEERSRRIAKNLPDTRPAHENPLCLKCHVHPGIDTARHHPLFARMDGVGCESCHGPAEKWLSQHYLIGRRGKRDQDKTGDAPRDLKDLAARAQSCVACHVGSEDAEVDHDLIAAGHPRLAFEFGAYLANLPRHWQIKDADAHPDFQVRAWAVGQIVSARAALRLLEQRASRSDKPWPEFAEYNCYACHKDLRVNSPREAAGYGGRRPGMFPWGDWYLNMVQAFGRQTKLPELSEFGKTVGAVSKLRELMEQASPPRDLVAREAGSLVKALDSSLEGVQRQSFDLPSPRSILLGLLAETQVPAGKDRVRADGLSWDEATQLYLAIVALHHGLTDIGAKSVKDASLKKDIEGLARRLRQAFPKDYDSPRLFDPMSEPKLGTQLESIRKRLRN